MATVKRLSFNREKQILVNLILETKFCAGVLPYLKDTYFKSQYAHSLIHWVRVYFETYGIAPKSHITDIFYQEKDKLDEGVVEQIENTLQYLSDLPDNENTNIDYLIDNAIDFCRERHLSLQIDAARNAMDKGDVLGAESAIAEVFTLKDQTSKWERFDDIEFIRSCVRSMVVQQDLETAFFTFDGRLGEFIGPMNRGWFIAFLAPAKKGKTTYLMETIISGIRQRKNVIILSLEMPVDQLFMRYMLATAGQKPETAPHTVMVPIMDCRLNQNDSCEKAERVGDGLIVNTNGTLQSYEHNEDWVVCTVCRGKSDFVPAAWKVPIKKKFYLESDYVKKIKSFSALYGKHCRAIHIPSKTATVKDLQSEVQYIIDSENFIPDIIVIDYADLIKPENGGGVKRHDLDDVWEGIRAWGQTDGVLMVSASQTNRLSADALYMKDTHVAEDYSKIAKLDIAIGLCQNDSMKEVGMMNLNKVAHRHNEYIPSHTCTVLQELSHQQAVLDSEFTAGRF